MVILCASSASALAQAPQQQPKPYDIIRRTTGSHIGERDPMGLGLRLHVGMQSPYALWCASPELFFSWAKASASEFSADAEAILVCHGNPVPAAISSYVPSGPLGKLSVGLVHFDDAARMPFQLELLQGLITLRLLAQQSGLELSDEQLDQLLVAMTEGYGSAASSDRNAESLLSKDDPWIARLLSSQNTYADLLDRYASIGQFRHRVRDSEGRVTELLYRPANDIPDAVSAALAEAAEKSTALAQISRYRRRDEFREAIRDVARRTEVPSSFNPGVKQHLVLLLRPFRDVDHDVILCFRQQIAPAAERAGLTPRENVQPAQRVTRAAAAMSPQPFVLAPATLGASSCTIELLDPWSRTLAEQDVKEFDEVLRLAKIWAVVVGSSHQQANHDQVIARRLTPELRPKLKSLSDSYLKHHLTSFERLNADPATRTDATGAREALSGGSD